MDFSDYFDDDLEEETKALQEFYSFLNADDHLQNNNCASDGIQTHKDPSPQKES